MKRSSRATGLSATTRQTATSRARARGPAELDGETFLLLKGNGFWRELWDRHFPRSQFLVQEDHAVFEQPAR